MVIPDRTTQCPETPVTTRSVHVQCTLTVDSDDLSQSEDDSSDDLDDQVSDYTYDTDDTVESDKLSDDGGPCKESTEGSKREEMDTQTHPVTERKFIVFESNLDDLFVKCQECGSKITEKSKKTCGSSLTITSVCESGHSRVWHSQPHLGHQPVGNILLASAILKSGGLYKLYSVFASLLNLVFIGRTTFLISRNIFSAL